MANCEFSVLKSELSEQMIDEELKNYKKVSDNIAEKIEMVKDQIDASKEQLVSAKEIRRNKLEYSSMARLIKEEPDRKEIIQKHETLKEELQKQNEQFQKVNRVLENRRKDFASFMLLTQELLKDINVPTETNGSNELDIDDGTLDDDDDIEKMMIDD
jgi:THO complex subunit 7